MTQTLTQQARELRFLHADGSGMGASDVSPFFRLVSLSLARCGLHQLFTSFTLHNLRNLSLDFNRLTEVHIKHLSFLPKLRHLSLAGNPLTSVFENNADVVWDNLYSLDLSLIKMRRFDLKRLKPFPNLRNLNLHDCGVEEFGRDDSEVLPSGLRRLDVRGCPLTHFPYRLLRGLDSLETVQADNYKLCCSDILPLGFNPAACSAPSDEVSSCRNLLRSHVYRVSLGVMAVLTLTGNLAVFVKRAVVGSVTSGFHVFTLMLCVSDWLMGAYLAVIGVADRLYLDSYLRHDVAWRTGNVCAAAGFLCTASTEASALFVCLITADRLLVLLFPFSRLRFGRKTGALAAVAVWLLVCVLAAVPLLPATRHWGFYSHNAICMPLPITRRDFPGHRYAFGLFIVLNLALFVFIAVGQLLIYLSVRKNSLSMAESLAASSPRDQRDQRLARRLFTVVMSDFLCWFPIGLLGLLSKLDVAVSGEVNVAMAIFVLPVNSAINPFLYTVNKLLEKRRLERERRFMDIITARVKNQAAQI